MDEYEQFSPFDRGFADHRSHVFDDVELVCPYDEGSQEAEEWWDGVGQSEFEF